MSITAALFKKVVALTRRVAAETSSRDEKTLVNEVYRLDPQLRRQRKKLVDEAVRAALQSLRIEDEAKAGDTGSSASESDNVDDAAYYDEHQYQKYNRLNKSLTSMYAGKKTDGDGRPVVADVLSPPLTADLVFSTSVTTILPSSLVQSNKDETPILSSSIQKDKRKVPVFTTSDHAGQNTKKRKTVTQQPYQSQSGDGDSITFTVPTARLSDLGGVESCIENILELVAMPLLHPEIYSHVGVSPPRGILLHGPPGCGKTLLANAIAGELGVPFMNVSAPSIVSGMSGESEKKIREIFDEARRQAPCIVFLDEIDAITPKRESAQREMERRIVAQLLTCIDELSFEKTNCKAVMILGATNRPDSIDPALRRAGRFDREICMGVPDQASRVKILQVLSSKLRLTGDFDFEELARLTPGYVGADLNALTAEAGMVAVKRIFETLGSQREHTHTTSPITMAMDVDATEDSNPVVHMPSLLTIEGTVIAQFLQQHPLPLTDEELTPLCITREDFLHALKRVQPSSKREGFATVPGVTWEQIGALNYVRDELRMAIVEPIRHPEFFAKVGIDSPSGVLLWGPPGCGKTLLAKAVANESHSNFISVKGPELLNKYVGESERAVRQVFARARASAPCVIFFDEIDALVPRRDDAKSEASARVVNTLLAELDGLESRKKVFIIGATNRPDIIDSAMIRPGRLDKLLYVELPTADERVDILRTVCQRTPLGADFNIYAIGHHPRCEGFSGADLAALIREASVCALRSALDRTVQGRTFTEMTTTSERIAAHNDRVIDDIAVTMVHIEMAFIKVFPSVSKKDKRAYDLLKTKFFSNTIKSVPEIVVPDKEDDKKDIVE